MSRRASRIERLSAVAAKLGRPGDRRKPRHAGSRPADLPRLLVLTDPRRTPDPVALALSLPRGCGLVYRAFGAAEARGVAHALKHVARRRGLVLLIGADAQLAATIGADGVHLPERDLHLAPRLRARWPRWWITGAAHGTRALRTAARCGLDAALLSPAFPSASPSAGRALDPVRFAALARQAGLPVFALGGITPETAVRLADGGAAGLAGIGFAAAHGDS